MKCPNCAPSELEPVLTTQGVAVDRCGSSGGVWLDCGEIFHFAKRPKRVAARLAEALGSQTPSAKLSPAAGQPMVEIADPGGTHIDYCRRTGGLWLDAGELKALLESEPGLGFSLDRKAAQLRPGEPEARSPKDELDAVRHAQIAAGLLPLPNLVLRSTATLARLYAPLDHNIRALANVD